MGKLIVEAENEERKQKKECKHVSFNLKKNQTSVIMTATIPGLVVNEDETKSSKKKKKKRKKITDVGQEPEVVTPSVTEWDPKKKLEKLKKKLRKLEENEA